MAKEYIERAVVLAHIKEAQCQKCSDIGLCGNCAVLTAVRLVESVPAADVVEAVHSKWDLVDNEQYAVCLSCECCIPMAWSDDEVYWNYCPNCGAKMDGGQSE